MYFTCIVCVNKLYYFLHMHDPLRMKRWPCLQEDEIRLHYMHFIQYVIQEYRVNYVTGRKQNVVPGENLPMVFSSETTNRHLI